MKRKNNKNKMSLFVIFAVILTIIALIATSGTYAKYTGEINSTAAEATIAKWDVIVNTKNLGTSETFTFNLFDTIYDTFGGGAEDNVSDGLIAPGTYGYATISITNNSQVDIEYQIELTEASENAEIPIEFAVRRDGDTSEYVSLDDLADLINETDNLIEKESSTAVDIDLLWRWPFSESTAQDTSDTDIGSYTETAPTYGVTAKVIATQVD